MRWLVLLALAQNLNVTPIEVRQGGVRVPQRVVQRQYVIDCGSNVTCGVDAGVMYLSAASGSGGGKVGEAFMADASITAQYLPITCGGGQFVTCSGTACTCATPAGSGGKVAEAYMADASITAQALDHTPTGCSAGQYATAIDSAGNLTCATPAGGAGPNVGQFYVYFGNGSNATTQSLDAVVSASWVSPTSSIVMSPACWVTDGGVTTDECRLVQPECSVTAVTASTSFTIGCTSETGGFGNYTMSYSGL